MIPREAIKLKIGGLKIKAITEDTQTIKRVTWGPAAAIIITVLVYFLSQIIGGIVVSIYPLIRQWNDVQANDWLKTSVLAQFLAVVAIDAAVILLLRAFLKRRRSGFSALGLKKPKWRDLGYTLAGFGVYFGLFIVVLSIAQALVPNLDLEQKQELGFSTATTGAALIPVFISLVLLPPVIEEILMRGFLYTGLRSQWGKFPAAVVTSLIFAAGHLQWGSGNSLLWVAAIDTLVLSFVLVYLRDRTDSLASPIMLHMVKNGLVFANLFLLR